MSPNSHNNIRSPDAGSAVEEVDKEAARTAARHRHRHHPVVKTLGTASEIADQIPLSIVCAAMIRERFYALFRAVRATELDRTILTW